MPDSPIMQQADSFVVVTYWTFPETPGMNGYDYEPYSTLNDALDAYDGYERGEYDKARPVGIFPVRNGMPLGGRLEPHYIAQLLKETRAA